MTKQANKQTIHEKPNKQTMKQANKQTKNKQTSNIFIFINYKVDFITENQRNELKMKTFSNWK